MKPESRDWHDQLLTHFGWLRNVVRSRLHKPENVEDVLQDVMADAIAANLNGTQVESIKPWLYRLAINRVYVFRRSAGRKRKAYSKFAADADGQADLGSTPLSLVLGKERRHMVAKALHVLGGADIEILVLKYVHNWSYDTISQNLGISHSKVTHRLRLARKRLRIELEKILDSEELK